MNDAEKFECLMNIIEHWTDGEADRYAGPFRHLSKDMWLREVCVTPGCSISVAQLKTFLATAVLEIYPWNNGSKISYRDIQKQLSGDETAKKYSFFFEELNKCFSLEENREAARRSRLSRTSRQLMGDMEEGGMVSLYLLERLQTMVWVKIGEYWRMCDPDAELPREKVGERIKWKQKPGQKLDNEENGEDEGSAKKQNKYMECFMTIALHEIFVRECERQYKVVQEEIRTRRNVVGIAKEEISALVEKLIRMDEEDSRAWEEEVENRVQEIKDLMKYISKHIYLLTVCMEHTIGAEVEILLAMILETKNLEIMRRDVSHGQQLMKYLECVRDRSTESFLRYNKNRSKYYRQLESDMEDILFHYMEHATKTKKQNFSEALYTYLTIVENEKLDEENRRRLWEAQCILVMPMWKYDQEK